LARSVVFLSLVAFIFVGCEALKTSKPIFPQKEYEKLLVGRYDADYVGTDNCLRACHYHDKIREDFEASTMGAQMSPRTGLPLVDCETCHGPGSLAIEGLTEEKVRKAAEEGKQLACDYKTFIDIKNLPPPAQSLLCLKCHTRNATFNLHAWSGGAHAEAGVSCLDCHNVHAGPDLMVAPRETSAMCYGCHEEKRMEFSLPSHHPVPEEKVFCTDCHQPHGTMGENLLRGDTVAATCARCHQEKAGPYVFEHADLMEDCTECHVPHGSVHNNLLQENQPFLCLQCHEGHQTAPAAPVESAGAFFTRCTDCHSRIHGTDIPSPGGRGRFIR
jgi:DmsE family decaheme c-type cytochrome